MPIVFYYYFSIPYAITTGIAATVLILTYLLIIKAGKNQPEDVRHPNLLVYVGLINILALIVKFFIPNLYIYDFTKSEYQFYKIYHLSIWIAYSSVSFISFGVLLLIFGRTNREYFENYLTITGILMIIAFSLQIISHILFATYILDIYFYLYHIIPSPVRNSTIILNELTSTTFILAWIFIFIHGKKYDKNLFYVVLLTLGLNIGFYIYNSIQYVLSGGI